MADLEMCRGSCWPGAAGVYKGGAAGESGSEGWWFRWTVQGQEEMYLGHSRPESPLLSSFSQKSRNRAHGERL